jgi:hypothetical protein
MGIKDFHKFLELTGYARGTALVAPGSIILIDAMMLLHAQHGNAAVGIMAAGGAIRTRQNMSRVLESQSAAKARLTADMRDVPYDQLFDENRGLRPAALVRPPDGPEGPEPWIQARETILAEMARRLSQYIVAGLVPVLVWDPPITGGPRTPGKIPRDADPMLLRNADRTWIYAALRFAGFPTADAWTEGEKAACAAAQAGAAHVVLSNDADCSVLGTYPGLLGNGITLVAGGGGTLQGNVSHPEIARHLAATTRMETGPALTYERLVDAAVFLGCDFCPRQKGNGIVTLYKRTCDPSSGKYYAGVLANPGTDPEYAAQVRTALEFFRITDEDRARGAQMVMDALANAWAPRPDILAALSATVILAPFLGYVQRGPPRGPSTPGSVAPEGAPATGAEEC